MAATAPASALALAAPWFLRRSSAGGSRYRGYALPVSEVEPRKLRKKDVAPRRIPQLVVPVGIDDVREFVRDAVTGTSLVDPVASAVSGWGFFQSRLRFTRVDATHTRIEIDVVGTVRGAETFLYTHRIGEVDRFFVAVQDELDRRARWQSPPPGQTAIEGTD